MSSAQTSGPIAWMARNPVAANLLMVVVVLLGFVGSVQIKKEVFPSWPPEIINVTVPYPGATPQEVEEAVLIKVEEALQDLPELDRLISTATSNSAVVRVHMEPGADMARALNEVTNRVNSISAFPDATERVVIEEVRAMVPVVNMSVFGDVSEAQLKELADRLRDELLGLGGITEVEILGDRDYEIAIELPDSQLRRYGLSFDQVVAQTRAWSANLPGGRLRTDAGAINLRSQNQAYVGEDFAQIPLITDSQGSRVLLGDIANIEDGFADQPVLSSFDGKRALRIRVSSVGDQNALDISSKVREWVDQKQSELPETVELVLWQDWSKILKGRLNLLLKNAAQGGVLVLLVLALFLRPAVALWVVIGVPFCFMGALFIMNSGIANASINVLSLFGFLLVLGIVVDDAIVTGESAFAAMEKDLSNKAHTHEDKINSVVRGVRRVSVATIFGVLTTIIAFIPMGMLDSGVGRFLNQVAIVTAGALVFSIIETKLILPAHLTHVRIRPPGEEPSRFARFQGRFSEGLQRFVKRFYEPALRAVLSRKYLSLASFIGVMVLLISLVPAGIVRLSFFPNIPSDGIEIQLELPPSAPWTRTHDYAKRFNAAAAEVNERYRKATGEVVDAIEHVELRSSSDTSAAIDVTLRDSSMRSINSVELAKWLREAVGPLPGVKRLSYNANAGPSEADIDFRLRSNNLEHLRAAAEELSEKMAAYPAVQDVFDTFGAGAPEVEVTLLPTGAALGLTQTELARQVRQAFFGAEIQRVQRGRHEVRVYVRLPETERNNLNALTDLWISLPNGEQVPFNRVASAEASEGISTINRQNRYRVVNVRGTVDRAVGADDTIEAIERDVLPKILEKFPEMSYRIDGLAEQQADDIGNLKLGGLIVLVFIYGALAIPLKSYFQPFYIMSAIPFAVGGAIIGHWLLGRAINVFSLIGILALAGVVVNDSLVLVDYINQQVREGVAKAEAIVKAGSRRFRAVILTSATTFLGLLPIQFETSIQSEFVKPMAISVGFGVLFATFITLFLVPVLMTISLDLRLAATALWRRVGKHSANASQ